MVKFTEPKSSKKKLAIMRITAAIIAGTKFILRGFRCPPCFLMYTAIDACINALKTTNVIPIK